MGWARARAAACGWGSWARLGPRMGMPWLWHAGHRLGRPWRHLAKHWRPWLGLGLAKCEWAWPIAKSHGKGSTEARGAPDGAGPLPPLPRRTGAAAVRPSRRPRTALRLPPSALSGRATRATGTRVRAVPVCNAPRYFGTLGVGFGRMPRWGGREGGLLPPRRAFRSTPHKPAVGTRCGRARHRSSSRDSARRLARMGHAQRAHDGAGTLLLLARRSVYASGRPLRRPCTALRIGRPVVPSLTKFSRPRARGVGSALLGPILRPRMLRGLGPVPFGEIFVRSGASLWVPLSVLRVRPGLPCRPVGSLGWAPRSWPTTEPARSFRWCGARSMPSVGPCGGRARCFGSVGRSSRPS